MPDLVQYPFVLLSYNCNIWLFTMLVSWSDTLQTILQFYSPNKKLGLCWALTRTCSHLLQGWEGSGGASLGCDEGGEAGAEADGG